MEVAVSFLKAKIRECQEDTELSIYTKQHMIMEFTKAINILEYERYNFVPTKTSAEQLKMIDTWKDSWNMGDVKFVPELLGFTKAVVLDNAFAQSAIDAIEDIAVEEEVITTQHVENKEPLLIHASEIDETITAEKTDEVKIEGRIAEESLVEGKKKRSLFSWFK
jgi:hypothetical protein